MGGSLTKIAEKCRKCPYVKTCNHKMMEAVAYSEMPNIAASMSQSMSVSAAMPMLRETMKINDGHGNMIEVYKDEIEKQLYKELYKGLNLDYGA